MILSGTYFPNPIQERAAWMGNFATQFANVAISLGFTAADVLVVTNDNDDFQFCASATVEVEAYAKAFRQYRKNVTEGSIGDPSPAFPPNPGFGPPVGVPAGIFERLDNLIKKIKASSAYTTEVGALLGIVPELTTRPAPEDMQPVLKAEPMPGNKVNVLFKRKFTDGITLEIKVDNDATWSAAGRWVKSPVQLTIPENGQGLPRSVQVRARYVEGDTPVGLYSQVDTVSTIPTA